MQPDELTTAEAAAIAGVSARTIRNWRKDNLIAGVQSVDGWRIGRASLLAYLAAREGAEAATEADASGGEGVADARARAETHPPEEAVAETAGAEGETTAVASAVVAVVIGALVAELEAAREERERIRRENRDLAHRVGQLEAERERLLLAAPEAPRVPWWKRLFRGG